MTDGGAHAAIIVATGTLAYDQGEFFLARLCGTLIDLRLTPCIAIEYLRPNGALLVVAVPPDAVLKAPIFSTVIKSLRNLGVRSFPFVSSDDFG